MKSLKFQPYSCPHSPVTKYVTELTRNIVLIWLENVSKLVGACIFKRI